MKKLKPGDRKAFVLQNIETHHEWPSSWKTIKGIVKAYDPLIYFGDGYRRVDNVRCPDFLVVSKLPEGWKPYENQVVVLELLATTKDLQFNYSAINLWKLPEEA